MPHIMTVCTGNMCRSPATQFALQGYLGDAVTTSSSGTHALEGHVVPEQMRYQMASEGLRADSHFARQYSAELARDVDIIIAMTGAHRRWLVSETPAVLKKTFLLMEVAAAARAGAPLLGETPAERAEQIGEAVISFRPYLAGIDFADVPDPYRRSDEVYAESFAMIRDATRDIAAWVLGGAGVGR